MAVLPRASVSLQRFDVFDSLKRNGLVRLLRDTSVIGPNEGDQTGSTRALQFTANALPSEAGVNNGSNNTQLAGCHC